MVRLVLFLLAVLLLASGLAWLADRPGQLLVTWEGYEIETSVFRAVVILALLIAAGVFLWSLLRQVWSSPALISGYLTRRRQQRGLDALSSGMIAIGAGDRASATRSAIQARRSIPNEPLTHLLRAQAAQLTGDRATARRIFEAMLGSPDTEQLGLRGLYLEARREGEMEAAMQFADRAAKLNPRLGWPLEAQFEMQVKASDWSGAAETAGIAKRHGHLERSLAERRRALMLAAEAQRIEEADPDKALACATEAHTLAPDLIPAAAVAGRILAARGQTAKASKIIQLTWSKSPHPDLAAAYAYARIGDSTHDRLDRIKQLALLKPHDVESGVAWATAALDAREYGVARHALQPFLKDRLTRRVARLMARIELAETNDAGRARDWIARAATAARDPVWTADGVILDAWSPVSPVTGVLDAVEWRPPLSGSDGDSENLAAEIADLLTVEVGPAKLLEDSTQDGNQDGTAEQPSSEQPSWRARRAARIRVASDPPVGDADANDATAPKES
jgi:HemY protein